MVTNRPNKTVILHLRHMKVLRPQSTETYRSTSSMYQNYIFFEEQLPCMEALSREISIPFMFLLGI